MDMESVLSFLRDLARNNDREWFNANKQRYQESLEKFRGFIGKLLGGMAAFDPAMDGLDSKDTIFRIYKDIRFSKDKTPYKTHFGSWMARGGRKSNDAGYYFHLEPEGSFLAAGVHSPPKEHLHVIRQEIVFNPAGFREVFHDPVITSRYERYGEEDKLKKGPVGFPAEFELIDELKYKHYIFSRNYSDNEVLKPGFPVQVAEDCRGLFPVVSYLNHAMSFQGNQ